MTKKLLLLIAVLWSINGYAQKWEFQFPSKFQNTLGKAKIIDKETIYLVGNKGNMFYTLDGGKNWSFKKIPTENNIYAISFFNKKTGWVATNVGEIFATEDGGDNWTKQFTDTDARTIRHIDFADSKNGYAVGDDGYVNNVMFKTTDGGKNWSEVKNLPLKTGADFAGMFFNKVISADTIYAISWDNMFYKTINGGQSWDTTYIATDSTTSYFEGAFFLNSKEGWAVGPRQTIVHTNDYGKTWERQLGDKTKNDDGLHYFSEVTFIDNKNGYASAFANLYKTIDGGKNWMELGTAIGSSRKAFIGFVDANHGFASDGGRHYLTTDGTTWENINTNNTEQINSAINLGNGKIVAVASAGTIFKTVNGGLAWTLKPSGTTLGLRTLVKWNGNLIAAGDSGTIMLSTDEGETWTLKVSNTKMDLNSIHASDNKNGVALDANSTLIAVGDSGSIVKSIDGGNTWKLNSTKQTYSYASNFMTSGIKGFAVGTQGRIYKTIDAGETWTLQPISGFTRTINDVYFTSADTGWVVAARGIIYKTVNGGDTWLPQVSGTTTGLDMVKFYDANNGYIAGYNFIAKTSDGGKTWIQESNHPSGNSIRDIVYENINNVWSFGSEANICKYTSTIQSTDNAILHSNGLLLYPNPTNGIMKVNTEDECHIKIITLEGQEIFSGKPIQNTINLESIAPKGMYIYHLTIKEKTTTGKIIVN